jgi:hypothetical protein
MKKFGTGGSTNEDRMRRKTDDIQSDYQKAQTRNAGNTAKLNVAKAKYEQRMADAKDDMAKWSGGDRTATRAGEKAAESALSEARRTKGDSIARRDALGAKLDAEGPAITPSKLPDLKVSGAPSTAASSSSPAPRRSAPPPVTPRPVTPRPGAGAGAGAAGKPSDASKNNLEDIRAKGAALRNSFTGPPKPKESDNSRVQSAEARRDRMGSVLAAPFKAFANYNPVSLASSLAARAIFDGEPSKPSKPATPAAPRQRTALEAERKANYEKRAASERAAGRNGSADMFEREAARLKKGGAVKKKPAAKKPAVKKYAKGGSIDGCAIRGKTRAGRTK